MYLLGFISFTVYCFSYHPFYFLPNCLYFDVQDRLFVKRKGNIIHIIMLLLVFISTVFVQLFNCIITYFIIMIK